MRWRRRSARRQAFPGRQVVSLSGDGGFSMLMGDFLSLAQLRLPVKVVVFNNGALGFIELEQKSTGFLDFGTELKNPDFAAMAEAVGIRGIRLNDPGEVDDGIAAALAHDGPVLIDAVVNRSELAMPPSITVRDGEGLLALHGEGDHERSRRRDHRSRANQSLALRGKLAMSITTLFFSRLQLPARPRSTSFPYRSRSAVRTERTRLHDFITLMKPRVMLLAVFTALVGLVIAPVQLDPLSGIIAILAIATGAGAAGVLNMWYDADIDAVMTRTAMRPIPRGTISRIEALVFGLVLACSAVAALGFALNVKAAALLAFAIFFYVVVYTVWLKRHTPQNIVIGGAAGALPPMIGWAAATGEIGLEPFTLFLIIFLWTPPHFWALSLNRMDEYANAGVPMLPVVAGRAETTRQILIYSVLLVPVSILPWALGFAGTIYGVAAAVCGLVFVVLALQLARCSEADRRAPHRLFAFSILYLFVLFAALLAGNGSNRWSSMLPASPASTAAGSGEAESVRTARSSIRSDEV